MNTVPFRTRLFQLVTSLTLAWGLSASANAAVWYVDDSAPNGGTGTSWTSPFNTLQAALTAAATGDGRGTYKPAGPGGSRTTTFTINKSVTIKGGYCGYNDPNNNHGDVTCGGPTSTILSGDLNADEGPTSPTTPKTRSASSPSRPPLRPGSRTSKSLAATPTPGAPPAAG